MRRVLRVLGFQSSWACIRCFLYLLGYLLFTITSSFSPARCALSVVLSSVAALSQSPPFRRRHHGLSLLPCSGRHPAASKDAHARPCWPCGSRYPIFQLPSSLGSWCLLGKRACVLWHRQGPTEDDAEPEARSRLPCTLSRCFESLKKIGFPAVHPERFSGEA